ncbi:MAG: ABC transporter substrate-binding protein [Actinomycetaceae bacterium]|nr:ABC transporter substrate-binding protein [Actinomycetaceae bacterium]MDY5854077.1 ABC transporter substrate-binding protein [Arcanobacterium sp.]
MRKLIAGIAAASLAFALSACGGTNKADSGSGGGGAGSTEVGVVSWWSAGSEKDGYNALQEVFAKQNSGIKFVNQAVSGGGGSQAKQKLQADLAAKNPPDSYQAHAGAELSADIAAGYLQDVSALYDEFKLRDAFPKDLVDRVTVDGKIYSIPSNIHRANVVWASKAALDKAGIDPSKAPADLDAWLADLQKLRDAGVQYPLAVGMAWTQLELLETTLIADLGADNYNKLMAGELKWDDASVTKAFDHFDKLMKFADPKFFGEDWEPAMAGVIKGDGTQAYSVMGDWTPPAFDAAGKKYNEDFFAWPVPGTDGVFDFLADSFTLPVGAKHADGAKAWLSTISSKEGQIAFNKIKGSIPARSDLTDEEIGEFSAYQQDAMKSFKADKIVSSIAHGAALPLTVTEAMNASLGKYTGGSIDIAGLQKEFAAAAAK